MTNEVLDAKRWLLARDELLQAEKALTEKHDHIAALRRKMPWQAVEKSYTFELQGKQIGLLELFEGRKQLIVYHHMFKPGDKNPCSGCGMVVDSISHLSHLHARNTSLVLVATASQQEIAAFQKRMQWNHVWATTKDSFNADFGVTDGFGLNVFFNEGDAVYRTYFTSGRGVEALGSTWSYLDLTPLGRQETWEDSPQGTPQSAPYQWWRLHDSYES